MLDGITIDSSIHHGQPVITGTRVPVVRVLGSLAAGMTFPQVMDEYGISQTQIQNAIRYATHIIESERTFAVNTH